jgi:hypothetical protein
MATPFKRLLIGAACITTATLCIVAVADTPDRELAALMPTAVDINDLDWLEGSWGMKTPEEPYDKSCGANDGRAYIHLDMSDDRPVVTAPPEPTAPEGETVTAWTLITEYEGGFASISPRNWENSYLRVKPAGDEKSYALVELAEFNKDELVWDTTRTFYLEKCAD